MRRAAAWGLGLALLCACRRTPPTRDVLASYRRAGDAESNDREIARIAERTLSAQVGALQSMRAESTSAGVTLTLTFLADDADASTRVRDVLVAIKSIDAMPVVTSAPVGENVWLASDTPIRDRLAKIPGVFVEEACEPPLPRIRVRVDTAKASALGVDLLDVGRALDGKVVPTQSNIEALRLSPNVKIADLATVTQEPAPPTCRGWLAGGKPISMYSLRLATGAKIDGIGQRLAQTAVTSRIFGDPEAIPNLGIAAAGLIRSDGTGLLVFEKAKAGHRFEVAVRGSDRARIDAHAAEIAQKVAAVSGVGPLLYSTSERVKRRSYRVDSAAAARSAMSPSSIRRLTPVDNGDGTLLEIPDLMTAAVHGVPLSSLVTVEDAAQPVLTVDVGARAVTEMAWTSNDGNIAKRVEKALGAAPDVTVRLSY